ncbi:MAG TPA: hypothetical protein VFR47_11255, partial [Anaerolineales bacterium]|nr:hypothetical protein [Anaerolineales bacterium]
EGKPAILFLDLNTSKTYTYFREVGEQALEFRSAGINAVSDLQTNSLWDIRSGNSLQGSFIAASLVPTIYSAETMFSYFRASPYPDPLLAMWQRFASNIYITIAEKGYGQIAEDTHFPPLYPALMHLLSFVFGDAFLAGLFLSHAAILYSLKLLHEIFSQWSDPSSSKRAIAGLLLFPVSFFFFSIYSESLFLMSVLPSMRAMSSHSWIWAGFWMFCAILTRLTGVALLTAMLYLMWKDRPLLGALKHWIGLSLPGLSVLLYLYVRIAHLLQRALPFSEPSWYARLVPPWESYLHALKIMFSGHSNYIDLLNLATATQLLALFLWGWKKIPMEYNLYSAFTLLILFSRVVETKAYNSMLRFSLTRFPLFFILRLAGKDAQYQRIITSSVACLNLFLSAKFFGWGWVA